MKSTPYKPKSKRQEHLTPEEIYQLIEEKWGIKKEQLHDPCPVGTPYKAPCFFNGLYGDWEDFNYCNPMFDKEPLTAFVDKGIEQALDGRVSFFLVPTKTDQGWFQKLWDLRFITKEDCIPINHRIKFKNNKHSAPDTHLLVRLIY